MQAECMENKIAFMAMHCKMYQCQLQICFRQIFSILNTSNSLKLVDNKTQEKHILYDNAGSVLSLLHYLVCDLGYSGRKTRRRRRRRITRGEEMSISVHWSSQNSLKFVQKSLASSTAIMCSRSAFLPIQHWKGSTSFFFPFHLHFPKTKQKEETFITARHAIQQDSLN